MIGVTSLSEKLTVTGSFAEIWTRVAETTGGEVVQCSVVGSGPSTVRWLRDLRGEVVKHVF